MSTNRVTLQWRHAIETDFPAVTEIFNSVMRTSLGLYQEKEVTVENRIQYWKDRLAANFPFIVAIQKKNKPEKIDEGDSKGGIEEEEEEVIGFATYGSFRASYGYRFTVEHSIYLREDTRGKGLGEQLLVKVMELAKEQGLHAMIGAIDSTNEISLKLHAKYGFIEVGRLPEIGFKKGQWLTLVLMEKLLE